MQLLRLYDAPLPHSPRSINSLCVLPMPDLGGATHTWTPHLHPVGELLAAGKPPLIARAADGRLKLFMAHKTGEEWQVKCAVCRSDLGLLITLLAALLSIRALTTPERVIKARCCVMTMLLNACLVRLWCMGWL